MYFLIRGSRLWVLVAAIGFFSVAPATVAFGQAFPVCANPLSDPDGDGYGWENRASCRVAVSQTKYCTRNDSDSDGDGYGWENGQSCVVAETPGRINCQLTDSDPDGDGYGWENGGSCVAISPTANVTEEKYPIDAPACSDQRFDTDSDGFGWENSIVCTTFNHGDGGRSITDLVLVTGQSNALGAETAIYETQSFDENLDSPVKRVYAYTETGWSIASLRQIWDRNWYPRADIANNPANNFAFHFAKNVVLKDPKRVVGFVLVTAPGAPIANWDKGQPFYSTIQQKVGRALSALPHKHQVDAILWHQGESDYNDTDYYGDKLNGLIWNFRGESWVKNSAPFICGETYNSPVNKRLAGLNSDTVWNTACASSNDLVTVGDDIHFSAKSLRILGARYSDKYLEILNY